MKKLKIALVGVGQRGLQHLQALSDLKDEELISIQALVDPFKENLDNEKIKSYVPNYDEKGVKYFNKFNEMVDSVNVDAIWFVIPPNQHKNEIIYAADKGIAIFAEKPQSLFLDEVFPMAEAIEKNNVPSICGFQMEYDTWYSKVRSYLSDKEVSSIMMINCGAVETHGVKHTIINKNDGPQDRIWTADRKWSGTSMVEAGIHQTDLMRYWTKDEIEWVSANYVERPIHLQEKEGDNPIAYHVSYGLKKGGIANLTLTKPAGVFFMERYDYILTTKSMIKFEKDLKVYGLGNDDYDINLGREHFKNNNIYKKEEIENIIAKGPHNDPMGQENTKKISENFIKSIVEDKPELRNNSFESSINSLSAVLAANVSASLGGEKINIKEFERSTKYSKFRKK
tara:strand:- start:344 stop:1534 length:1191 start_codon:yes stop_codon:yes gene_type:complete